MTKLSTRFKLGLSTSIPVAIFPVDGIIFVPDIGDGPSLSLASLKFNRAFFFKGHPNVMTDGCGRINETAMRMIQHHRGLKELPHAIQARIAGAKGLWLLDKSDQSDQPMIWCTQSQIKVQYADATLQSDPSLRILDLLRVNRTKYRSFLTTQPIVNLAHNGVGDHIISRLLQDALKSEIDRFLDMWSGGPDDRRLWLTVFQRGKLSSIRQQRHSNIHLRELIPSTKVSQEEETATNADPKDLLAITAPLTSPDPYSGYPWSAYERAADMLAAGFIPSQCAPLAETIRQILHTEREEILLKLRFPLDYSAEAWSIPGKKGLCLFLLPSLHHLRIDFWGFLQPGEIHFRPSEPLDQPDGSKVSGVSGPVVVRSSACTSISTWFYLMLAASRYGGIQLNCPQIAALLQL